jgi:hypothetical protein
MIKNVADYFLTPSTIDICMKYIKVFTAAKAVEFTKEKNQELKNIIPSCGLFMIWIKNKFKADFSLEMSVLEGNLINKLSKSILGKPFQEICKEVTF